MERMTARELDGMYCRAIRAAVRVGLDVEGWALVTGSATYGRQWRLVRIERPSGGEQDLHRLGRTAREAYDALHALAWAWESVADCLVTREQVQAWEGPLSDKQWGRLVQAAPLSSIPDAVAEILGSIRESDES